MHDYIIYTEGKTYRGKEENKREREREKGREE
jgi:hypothetical protein